MRTLQVLVGDMVYPQIPYPLILLDTNRCSIYNRGKQSITKGVALMNYKERLINLINSIDNEEMLQYFYVFIVAKIKRGHL